MRGIVNLWCAEPLIRQEGISLIGPDPLCGGSPRDVVPDLESLGHDVAICRGGELVASRTEVLGDGTTRREETLRMSW